MAQNATQTPAIPASTHVRQVRLTPWHGLLILLMLWGFFTAVFAAAERVLVNWREPSLIYLLLLVSVEAILTQRLVARERRRPEEQAGIRGLELVVIILLSRAWSLGAEDTALIEVVEPWLRSPLTFFGGSFGKYFFAALAAWGLATMLAADVINWTTDWVIPPHSDSTIERDQLRRNWDADNIVVDANVHRRWGRPAALLVLGLVLAAPLVSWLVLLTPLLPVVPLVNLLLGFLTIVVSLAILVLLSPLILLLSLLRGQSPQIPPQLFQPPRIPVSQEPIERPLLPALVFWGCVLLLVAIALVRYVQGRADLQDTLRRWRLTRWLLQLFGAAAGLWEDARGWAELAGQRLREAARRRKRRVRRVASEGPHAHLRALFRRMQTAGARRGVPPRAAQTPLEYAAALGQSLPVARDDVEGLTEAYVIAEYGPRAPRSEDIRRARQHWRRLQRWLFGSARVRKRMKDEG